MSTFEEILSAALALPRDLRAALADHLLDSLNGEDQKRIDALWAEEAERRLREIDEGRVDHRRRVGHAEITPTAKEMTYSVAARGWSAVSSL